MTKIENSTSYGFSYRMPVDAQIRNILEHGNQNQVSRTYKDITEITKELKPQNLRFPKLLLEELGFIDQDNNGVLGWEKISHAKSAIDYYIGDLDDRQRGRLPLEKAAGTLEFTKRSPDFSQGEFVPQVVQVRAAGLDIETNRIVAIKAEGKGKREVTTINYSLTPDEYAIFRSSYPQEALLACLDIPSNPLFPFEHAAFITPEMQHLSGELNESDPHPAVLYISRKQTAPKKWVLGNGYHSSYVEPTKLGLEITTTEDTLTLTFPDQIFGDTVTEGWTKTFPTHLLAAKK